VTDQLQPTGCNRICLEIAGLLAQVYLRLQHQSMKLSAPQNVPHSGSDCLACGAKALLTVHTS